MKLEVKHEPKKNKKVVAVYNKASNVLILPLGNPSGPDDAILIASDGRVIQVGTTFEYEINARKNLPEMQIIHEEDYFSFTVKT